jgi:hypothetical protein
MKRWRVCMNEAGTPISVAPALNMTRAGATHVPHDRINWDHSAGTPPDTDSVWFVEAHDEMGAYAAAIRHERETKHDD